MDFHLIKKLPGVNPHFENHPTPIVGIKGQPFLNFSDYCNFDLQKIDDEICLGLAKHDTTQLPAVSGATYKDLDSPEFVNKFFEHTYLANASNDEFEILKDLTINQRRKYLFFKNKLIQPWSFIFVLKPNTFITKTQNLYDWLDFVNADFSYTKKCIESLPLVSIGRAVIYASYANHAVVPHRDGPVQVNRDHHININPAGYRPIYIYDEVKKEKVYLPRDHHAYSFNVRDIHGVDAVPNFSYTLRVDGEFTEEVLTRFNIENGVI